MISSFLWISCGSPSSPTVIEQEASEQSGEDSQNQNGDYSSQILEECRFDADYFESKKWLTGIKRRSWIKTSKKELFDKNLKHWIITQTGTKQGQHIRKSYHRLTNNDTFDQKFLYFNFNNTSKKLLYYTLNLGTYDRNQLRPSSIKTYKFKSSNDCQHPNILSWSTNSVHLNSTFLKFYYVPAIQTEYFNKMAEIVVVLPDNKYLVFVEKANHLKLGFNADRSIINRYGPMGKTYLEFRKSMGRIFFDSINTCQKASLRSFNDQNLRDCFTTDLEQYLTEPFKSIIHLSETDARFVGRFTTILSDSLGEGYNFNQKANLNLQFSFDRKLKKNFFLLDFSGLPPEYKDLSGNTRGTGGSFSVDDSWDRQNMYLNLYVPEKISQKVRMEFMQVVPNPNKTHAGQREIKIINGTGSYKNKF
ncbi:MAG: hypothetical protein AB8E15_01740 [Bdellovibrionales bacterium]